ncbi:DNA repair protein RecO [Pseudomonas sp. F1_0610]|uniref:DNA repair protein RecO n=1 Tax=Pseudomonas sp. F1_0610 TaxID=3114284 RepID=UPI0039C2FCB9
MLSAYVLHSRPYKESSALVDLFTEQGRMRAVLRGARSQKGSQIRPFSLLEIELKGRGELKNIAQHASMGPLLLLQGTTLFCGLYLNELLVRLLALEDPQPIIFQQYQSSLIALANNYPVEPLLRTFEWRLLEQLGYGFSLTHDAQGATIDATLWYALVHDTGFVMQAQLKPGAFKGEDLLALAQAQWQDKRTLIVAKRLMRQALAPLLGTKPLASRELFMGLKDI